MRVLVQCLQSVLTFILPQCCLIRVDTAVWSSKEEVPIVIHMLHRVMLSGVLWAARALHWCTLCEQRWRLGAATDKVSG